MNNLDIDIGPKISIELGFSPIGYHNLKFKVIFNCSTIYPLLVWKILGKKQQIINFLNANVNISFRICLSSYGANFRTLENWNRIFKLWKVHCIKIVYIRSFSGPCFPVRHLLRTGIIDT